MSAAPELAERYAAVTAGIAEACAAAGRAPEEITLVVVTKFHPAQLIRELVELGARHVGENRHQDAAPKAAELADLPLTWHFVGQLQSNKAKAVARYADVIHSVDRASLVTALAGAERAVDVFLEVNLTDDPGRGGVAPSEVERLAEQVLATERLRLRGVMGVAPLDEDARSAFARLRAIGERVRTIAPHATDLSAGMSGDYAEAIAEGATHLRIGTAITGKRPAPH
ncbi:YggS family pyridoxal phosphate-dependent enzyme [Microcella alkalica]|uniref:YggS family pyridoxal phosphate-dependent enzyme n=1 Tax=Microcella alkalica TaxID=355930 RepID=UPI00145EF969|nr:YggS family pyridoxal phosphate-dependent enzyme [Microcella alkalica]